MIIKNQKEKMEAREIVMLRYIHGIKWEDHEWYDDTIGRNQRLS